MIFYLISRFEGIVVKVFAAVAVLWEASVVSFAVYYVEVLLLCTVLDALPDHRVIFAHYLFLYLRFISYLYENYEFINQLTFICMKTI